ncbi:MAG TPA: hypothetical protein VF157_12120 [Chloroflexota bacterium]
MADRLGTTSRLHGHDVHVRFNDRAYGELQAFADGCGLALNGCVRLLVERALAAGAGEPGPADSADVRAELKALNQSMLAALIACEQVLDLYVQLMPHGEERVAESWEQAASAARRRLLRVEQALREEEAAAC